MQEHVSNKSAYLCGVMKTYRQKTRAGASSSNGGSVQHQGPDEEKIKVGQVRDEWFLDNCVVCRLSLTGPGTVWT